LMKILMGEVCPLDYEQKIEPIGMQSIYWEIDKDYHATVFQNVEFSKCN